MQNNQASALGDLPPAYEKLRNQLGPPGWICQGTVVCRSLRRRVAGEWVEKGPYYLWTGKHKGKTVCHALSKEQFNAAKEAIAANRRVMKLITQMQTLTLKKILKTIPGVKKRK